MSICPFRYCETEFFPTHANQRYCSEDCRIQANNLKKKDKKDLLAPIYNQLIINRDILEKLYEKEKIEIGGEALGVLGFDFSYHTHTWKAKNGKKLIGWFDYGLTLSAKNQFLVNKLEI